MSDDNDRAAEVLERQRHADDKSALEQPYTVEIELSGAQGEQGPVGPQGPPGPPGAPPLVTADTATIDLTGAGVTGDPLSADVKANSVGVAIADTATIDLTGSGTAADPLKADILAVKIADTASIDMSGSGTVADPLKAAIIPGVVLSAVTDTPEVDLTNNAGNVSAALTGIRNGSWSMPAGDIMLGDPAVAVGRLFASQKLDGVDVYEADFYPMSGGAAVMRVVKNSVEVNRLRVNPDGSVSVGATGGIVRPMAWAVAAGIGTLPIVASVGSSVTVTYPVSRFTQAPLVFALPGSSSGTHASIYSLRYYTNSTTGCTVGCNQVTGATWTVAMPFSWQAIQMTPDAAVGLTADEPDPSILRRVTCHTDGCGNASHPIVVGVPEDSLAVQCGVCTQLITDIVVAGG